MNATARKKVLILIVAAPALSLLFLFGFATEARYAEYDDDGIDRAVIIDQLHDDFPNQSFQQKATEYLETGGYQVDLYTTKDITVDFYKELPSMGYKFIVIRSHSGITPEYDIDDDEPNSLALFTGEKYEENGYIFEQLFGEVLKSKAIFQEYETSMREASGGEMMNATTSQSGTYFSVGSKFIDKAMHGKLPDSIIIVGGCNTLSNTSLADALLRRGASAIIGWDDTVGSSHNDKVILDVLTGLLVDGSDVRDVTRSAMETFGPDPEYSGVLKYHPDSAAGMRL